MVSRAVAERLALVWDDRFRAYDFGPGHPFTERSRASAVRLAIRSVPSPAPWRLLGEIAPAPAPTLERFHRADYLERVRAASRAPPESVVLDQGDTPAFPGCHEAAARVVGGAVAALRALGEEGVRRAFHPAGGLHHAHPDRASGFCIYNDVAVAIATARQARRTAKVAYVDIDAHHGDGVMYGFYDDGRVLDIDFHQDGRTLFPGTGAVEETGRGDGEGLKVNLPLPPGSGDAVAAALFRRVALPLVAEFRPDLIVLQHGVDGHRGDRLAQLDYTEAFYASVRRGLGRWVDEAGAGRLLVTGGGGYSPAAVATALARCALDLAESPPAGAVPELWRTDFAQEFGEPAPERWEPELLDDLGASAHGEVEELVERLEVALGRRFPAP